MHSAITPLKPILGKRKRPLVIEALTALARETGAGGKLPTMLELSRSLKVAIGTLDDCLGALEARGIIHRKHGSGIYVTPHVSQKRMGLVFGRNIFCPGASPFYSILLQHCVERARDHHARFSFFLDSPDLSGTGSDAPVHQDLADALAGRKLDGLLATCLNSKEQEEWLLGQGIPVVTLGSRLLNAYRVSADYDRLVEMAVEGLVQAGCKRIGLLGVEHSHGRYFRRALKKYGLPCRPRWVACPEPHVFLPEAVRESVGRDAVLERFGMNPVAKKTGTLPDGLVITDDMIAQGTCAQLESLGWAIGTDIKIASHANRGSLALAQWEEKIVRVEIDPQEVVNALFSLLEPRMEGFEIPSSCILLKPTLRLPR